jgi:hypothetical protein
MMVVTIGLLPPVVTLKHSEFCSQAIFIRRMPFSGMWCRVDLVWTDVSEERIASCNHLLPLVPRSWIFLPWRWSRYVLPKRRFTQDLHCATFQNTAFFIVTTVTTSTVTFSYCSYDSQNKQHQPAWACNVDVIYFLCGWNWIFKYYLEEFQGLGG